jgi:hypothetical protein
MLFSDVRYTRQYANAQVISPENHITKFQDLEQHDARTKLVRSQLRHGFHRGHCNGRSCGSLLSQDHKHRHNAMDIKQRARKRSI